jgi:hypothetical protein
MALIRLEGFHQPRAQCRVDQHSENAVENQLERIVWFRFSVMLGIGEVLWGRQSRPEIARELS